MKEQKDVRQRIEEGEFAQSAEISASYLDEDILIIDNVKVLQNPDPMRFQMNMIASCQRGSLRAELNGREFTVEKGDIFISPPNSILDIKEVSEDFACTAMCVSNHGLLGILRSHISVWNRAMYVSKVSVLKMNEVDMGKRYYILLQAFYNLPILGNYSHLFYELPYALTLYELRIKYQQQGQHLPWMLVKC